MRCARIEAALNGEEFVTPDHIKTVAKPVMAHRLVLTPDAMLEGIDSGTRCGPDTRTSFCSSRIRT